MPTTLKELRTEHHGSGMYIAAGELVDIIRTEGERVVIRGPGLFYSCNPAKQPTPAKGGVTMLVSRDCVSGSRFWGGSLVKVQFNGGQHIGRVVNVEQSRADGHFNYAVRLFNGASNVYTESQLLAPFNTPVVDVHGTLSGEYIDMNAPLVHHADKRLRVTSKGRLIAYWQYSVPAVGGLYIVPAGYRGLYQVKQRGPHDAANPWKWQHRFYEYLAVQKI